MRAAPRMPTWTQASAAQKTLWPASRSQQPARGARVRASWLREPWPLVRSPPCLRRPRKPTANLKREKIIRHGLEPVHLFCIGRGQRNVPVTHYTAPTSATCRQPTWPTNTLTLTVKSQRVTSLGAGGNAAEVRKRPPNYRSNNPPRRE